jgi:signal peptide peptidase SppA
MNLQDQLFALTPAAFDSVQTVLERHLLGESPDLAAIEAKLGRPLANTQPPLNVENGVAVISLEGVLAKRMNLFTQISGGTSTQIAGQQFAQALADPQVTAIVLSVDSPGGTVDGTQALADQIFAARGAKPIVAACDGLCASAAYWIASAADQVFIAGDTCAVGSIGVIATHTDSSAADAMRGQTKTVVRSAALKAVPDDSKLTETGLGVLQSMVNKTHGVFAATVGRNRDLSGAALDAVSTGAIFLGGDAVANGLVDGMQTLDQTVAKLQGRAPAAARTAGQRAAAPAAVARPMSIGDMTIAIQRYTRDQAAMGHVVTESEALAYLRNLK